MLVVTKYNVKSENTIEAFFFVLVILILSHSRFLMLPALGWGGLVEVRGKALDNSIPVCNSL